MGIFWASNPTNQLQAKKEFKDVPSACPVKSNIPIPKSTASSSLQSACPIVNNTDELDPNTNMPYNLSTVKAPGQTIDLPTNRSLSTIPRGDTSSEGVWEYPSPQQMFNAMLKKGKGDIPEDAVESMVNIHNFLNEGAWEEILEWEKPHTLETHIEPRLLKFTGRPDTMSPRAKYYNLMSKIYPEKYNSEPPFDRHDWTVLRSDGNGGWINVRYVIDYYSGGDDAFGLPSFFLDVRPALDNFGNAKDRFNHWTTEYKPLWDKAMGRVDNDNKPDEDTN